MPGLSLCSAPGFKETPSIWFEGASRTRKAPRARLRVVQDIKMWFLV
ncbi:hypothetical protein HMPREF0742_00966 [Rothia aeria F0184]|uniref:Uncharacterized protein n=1 Tax=Rothia aeria F0184 TaxID=888019 RepID=U7V4U3_9MICC|nr:hypothetical protein HMPREF0742_00966 [Rothia aeria F0184]